jgi:hypothetical protein
MAARPGDTQKGKDEDWDQKKESQTGKGSLWFDFHVIEDRPGGIPEETVLKGYWGEGAKGAAGCW